MAGPQSGNLTAVISPEQTRVSGRRVIAHLADGVVLMAILLVVGIPAAIVSDILLTAVLVGWVVFGQLAYFVVLQRRAGQTPGKRLSGIRVVDADGATPSTGALVKRTLPLYLEYLYVIALVGILSSRYRQRFGDRWAKTYVVDA